MPEPSTVDRLNLAEQYLHHAEAQIRTVATRADEPRARRLADRIGNVRQPVEDLHAEYREGPGE